MSGIGLNCFHFFFLFIYLGCTRRHAGRILVPLAQKVQGLNHWTIWEVPLVSFSKLSFGEIGLSWWLRW